jgi:ribosome maturation factor RimP
MIKQELIENLVSEALTEEYFIVQVTVKKGNVIDVVIDGDNGVAIQKCVEISRQIEQNLDRETEDFELTVSSAGLSNPFLVYRQYLKNIGKEVEVKTGIEKPITGNLIQVDQDGFDLETRTLEKEEGKNKKVEVFKTIRFNFDSKPEVTNSISFK